MEMSVKEWFRNSTIILCQGRISVMPDLDCGKTTKSHQTIMQFYLECKELVRDCQYGNMEDELLLDHLIFEIKNDRLREKAIEEEWNLQRFLEVASRQLASSRQADEISGSINIKKEPEDDERIRKIKHKNPKKRMQDA